MTRLFPPSPSPQDDHMRPVQHAPRGRARLADHDVGRVGEEPPVQPLHARVLNADGAGLQEPVEWRA